MINLTKKQVENIQFDEGLVYINFGLEAERMLGPIRGGSTFNANATLRDVEYDGRQGPTKGMQIVESQEALLKTSSLCCSQEDLILAMPGAKLDDTTKVIKNVESGTMIPEDRYLDNVTVFAKLAGGNFKKITIFNAMHEGAMEFAAKPKAENEHALELKAHFDPFNRTKEIYKVEDIAELPVETGGNE